MQEEQYENSPATFTFVLTQAETALIEDMICFDQQNYQNPLIRALLEKIREQMHEQQG